MGEMIEIVVDGLPVPVDEDDYLADAGAVEDKVRENRAAVRLHKDADHDLANRILRSS